MFESSAAGAGLETARTVVNTLVVIEIFYLFSVRYLRRAALCWDAWTGNRVVLVAVAG